MHWRLARQYGVVPVHDVIATTVRVPHGGCREPSEYGRDTGNHTVSRQIRTDGVQSMMDPRLVMILVTCCKLIILLL